jgi:hypothetical protein
MRMSDMDMTAGQSRQDRPQPGYREATLDPMDAVVCQRCGALVVETDTDLHDRFHVSVEHPATMPATSTRGGWEGTR